MDFLSHQPFADSEPTDRRWLGTSWLIWLDSGVDGGGCLESMVCSLLTILLIVQANICDMLSIDDKYIVSLPKPVAPWGEQAPNKWVASLPQVYYYLEQLLTFSLQFTRWYVQTCQCTAQNTSNGHGQQNQRNNPPLCSSTGNPDNNQPCSGLQVVTIRGSAAEEMANRSEAWQRPVQWSHGRAVSNFFCPFLIIQQLDYAGRFRCNGLR
jgi:hypothetical protein